MGEVISRPLDHRYMKVVMVRGANGKEYPCAETAPAVVVLPWRQTSAGPVVYLLEQPRPELRGAPVLKTVGGYANDGETSVEAAIRHLATKAGLVASVSNLQFINCPVGYPVLYAPIEIFRWQLQEAPRERRLSGLRLLEVTLVEALQVVRRRELFDAATSEPIVDLAIDLGLL